MSFMTKIKAKYILRLAEQLASTDPLLSHDLKMLVAGATNAPHPRPTVTLGSLTSVFHNVINKLNSEKLIYALAGGLAVVHWVDIRQSLDIDLVLYTNDIEQVKTIFPGGRDLPLMYTVRLEGVDIDFIKGDLFPWIENALTTACEDNTLGTRLKIIRPEYLILFKFRAGRERDLSDIKGLLSLSGIAEKARHLVNQYMPDDLDDLEQMIREVEYGV